MSISSTTNRVSFSGNGATVDFSFPYYFASTSDLVVIQRVTSTGVETVKTLTTHYTVAGTLTNGVYAAGGTVTMLTAPPTGQTLTIYRDPAATQGLDLVENDNLPAESVEQAFDKGIAIAQRLKNRIDRSVTLSEGYTASFTPTLPSLIVADTVLAFNSTGTGFATDAPTVTDIADASTNATAAAASAAAALSSQTAAAASETAAAASAASAAAQLASSFWRDVIYITSADSPVTISAATHNGKALAVDSSGGAVAITLPAIAGLTPPFNFGVVVKTAGNNVTISRSSTDTIMGATSKVLSIVNTGCQLIADTGSAPDDWTALDFGTVADLGVTQPKLAQAVFNDLTAVTGVSTDYVAISDTSDSGNKKKALVSDIQNGGYRSVTTTDSPTVAADKILSLSGASFTVTLPTAVGCTGKEFILIHQGTSHTQVYTLNTTGGQTIGGIASGAYALYTNGESLKIVSNNANWLITDHYAVLAPASAGAITITSTGGGVVKDASPVTDRVIVSRRGKFATIRWEYLQDGVGTTGTGSYLFTLPNSLAIDTTLLSSSTTIAGAGIDDNSASACGTGYVGVASSSNGELVPYVYDANTIWCFATTSYTSRLVFGSAAYGLGGSAALGFSITIEVPITGWQP